MKIIKPRATIIEDELAALSIYQRIDACASVCYQRPPKPTEEEAQEFCRKMLSVKHMSTLEMARISVLLPWEYADKFSDEKYLQVDQIDFDNGVVSGSIRAFMDSNGYMCMVLRDDLLSKHYSMFFGAPGRAECSWARLAKPEEIPWQHKHVAARFIVNRAVSHELVRHRPCTFLQESQRYCRYEDEVTFIEPEWFRVGSVSMLEASKVFEMNTETQEAVYRSFLKRGMRPQQARAVLPNSTKTELICYASLPQWKHMFDLRCSTAADPEMRRVMIPLREEFKEKYKEVEW